LGTRILSDILKDTAAIFGMEQLHTTGGHPQTDGLVERLNRMLKSMLTKLVNKKGSDWNTKLVDGIQNNPAFLYRSFAILFVIWA